MTVPSLMVYAHRNSRGMRISAVLYHPRMDGKGRSEVLFRHEWSPKEVTELAIVEWATRALARWLEGQLMPETDG